MLSVCRRTVNNITPNSLRFISQQQQQQRWNSSNNSNNTPLNNDTNNNETVKSEVDERFQGLLNAFDTSASKQNKINNNNTLDATPISAVEGITNILQESSNKQQQQQNNNTSLFNGTNNNNNTFDMNHITLGLSSLTHAPYQLHVNASFNNTIITLTRPNGSPLITTSGGSAGFKKAQRSGYEAAHQASIQLLEKMQAKNLQVPNIHIVLKGFGPGRDAAFKALVAGASWNIRRITDATPIPFGGCRPKKARRL